MWHFAKSLPLCDLSDAVQDAGYQQGDDDKAAENDDSEKAPSHRLAPTMCKPRSMTPLLFAGAGTRQLGLKRPTDALSDIPGRPQLLPSIRLTPPPERPPDSP